MTLRDILGEDFYIVYITGHEVLPSCCSIFFPCRVVPLDWCVVDVPPTVHRHHRISLFSLAS